MRSVITGIFAATELRTVPGDKGNTPTGFFKTPVGGRVAVGPEGLLRDHQADKRVHGGPEKAVHHYAATNYQKLAERFPEIADSFVPGSIGENFSSSGLNEREIAIGDVFALGSTRLQVSQPRSPCWKMDARFGNRGVAKFVSDSCYQGWYYRVLETGEVEVGDELVLLARNSDPVSVAEFWTGWRERPPDEGKLSRLRATPGLAAVWYRYLGDRIAYLREHPKQHAPVVPAVRPKH